MLKKFMCHFLLVEEKKKGVRLTSRRVHFRFKTCQHDCIQHLQIESPTPTHTERVFRDGLLLVPKSCPGSPFR